MNDTILIVDDEEDLCEVLDLSLFENTKGGLSVLGCKDLIS